MSAAIEKIVIVGGGTAGWLAAGLLASAFRKESGATKKICLVESPDIPIIGVGEGTWPSMRQTLRDIGIKESDFLRECSASYKQGSKFCGWRSGDEDDHYYHPFDAPITPEGSHSVDCWRVMDEPDSYSTSVCPQEGICEQHLAPKKLTSPDYAGISNYGYHLDAGKFSTIVKQHCIEHLGVEFVSDNMTGIASHHDGRISAIETEESGTITGDFFVDCTGFRSLLLGGHFDVPLNDVSQYLFADAAIALQVGYGKGDPIQSPTVATAQHAGWIWDISLYSRRGVGHVYSSAHATEEEILSNLRSYLKLSQAEFDQIPRRKLTFNSGYRDRFWEKNCLAIGLSAGFVEPLEASALMLVETSLRSFIQALHQKDVQLERAADDFNRKFSKYWEQIVHFLKLHYALSDRTEPFWQEHRSEDRIPAALVQDLARWKAAMPVQADIGGDDALFPLDSYQYILCAMGFEFPAITAEDIARGLPQDCHLAVLQKGQRLSETLPDNRTLLSLVNRIEADVSTDQL